MLIAAYSCNYKKKNTKEDLVNSKVENKTREKYIIKEAKQEGKEKLQLIELTCISSLSYIGLAKGLKNKIIKNGGLTYGVFLERSLQETMRKQGRYSKTYDFTFYEIYEERRLNTYRFSFNPESTTLFEHSILKDSLVPMDFNGSILHKYDYLNKSQRVFFNYMLYK
ncbi:hypothetical protein [Carboxylicivirga taeanensis]|uniref:hypothetical protein n=1 Tax=Carboxylicivirga taeanensis TaxID=1416875 RepID=UPI003F6DF17F